MRKILILIILTAGLISTSLIKDNTRLLEKSLVNLNKEIISLESNLSEAKLDFEYLTTPKNIYFLAKDFLDDNFTHYKKAQIKILIKKEKNVKNFAKLEKNNNFNQSDIKKYTNINLFNKRELSGSKNISYPTKAEKWMIVQVLKTLFGLPSLPVK